MPAVIPIGAALISGYSANRSAKKAAQAQVDSTREANAATLQAQREAQAFQQKQLDQSRADNAPWLQAGTNALGQLSQRTAPGGDLMRNFGMADFQADPGYQFRMDQGMRGMTNSAAARGNLLSGAALKAASSFNQNMASNEFSNAYSRYNTNRDGQYNKLASLAGVGQVTADRNGQNAMQLGQSVGAGMFNNGQQMGNNLIGAGNARASGYMAQGNALINGINQGVSAWNQYQQNKPENGYGQSQFSDLFRPQEGSSNFIGPSR